MRVDVAELPAGISDQVEGHDARRLRTRLQRRRRSCLRQISQNICKYTGTYHRETTAGFTNRMFHFPVKAVIHVFVQKQTMRRRVYVSCLLCTFLLAQSVGHTNVINCRRAEILLISGPLHLYGPRKSDEYRFRVTAFSVAVGDYVCCSGVFCANV